MLLLISEKAGFTHSACAQRKCVRPSRACVCACVRVGWDARKVCGLICVCYALQDLRATTSMYLKSKLTVRAHGNDQENL